MRFLNSWNQIHRAIVQLPAHGPKGSFLHQNDQAISSHHEQSDDARDLPLAIGGDSSAFERIVRRHESRVAATVIGMLGASPEADDTGQEVFIRLHKSLGGFRQEAQLSTYITRIAINLWLDKLRSRQRGFGKWIGLESEALGPDEPFISGDDHIDERERARLVRHAVTQLKPSWRAVVVLRLLQGYSTLETAKLLGLPKGTVLSRLARASSRLRAWLGPILQDA
jgi:RNA polymerase sigma-70 factor, ECF subfamily